MTAKGSLLANGTSNIIQAMEQSGVKRLVCTSSLGVGDSKNYLTFLYKYILVPLMLRHVFADHLAQEEQIKASTLDWVIARPAELTNGAKTGKYYHGFSAGDKQVSSKISRADVADFMLKQLEDDTYLRKTPPLSN